MIWIAIATLAVGAFANLPLIFTFRRFDWITFVNLWKIAPHQFFFTAVFVPGAVWLTCSALWWTLRSLSKARASAPDPWPTIYSNWPVIFMGAIALAAIVAGVFFLSSTWSPDKLSASYAKDAVATVKSIDARYRSAEKTGSAAVEKLNRKKMTSIQALSASGVTKATFHQRYPGLDDFQKADVLVSKDSQQKYGLVDTSATALSAFQVLGVVGVAGVLLLTAIGLFAIGRQGAAVGVPSDLDVARTAVFFAIACWMPYPYLFGTYRNQMERVANDPDVGQQDIAAAIVIVAALALTVFSNPSVTLVSAESGATALIAVFALVGVLVPRLGGAGDLLRKTIGFESSLGIQVAMFLVATMGVTVAAVIVRPSP